MNKSPSLLKFLLVHAALVAACAVALYPVLWVVKMALTPSQAFSLDLNPLPTQFSLDNFARFIGARDLAGHYLFARQLFNSAVIALASTAVGIVFSASAAYAFSRFEFKGRMFGMNMLLVTQMFPGVVMAIPLYILLNALGLVNSIAGLVLVYSTGSVPFCVWMLKGYFDTIPKDLEEAAVMDGASRLHIFVKIILPLAKPAIVVTALFSFMSAWNEFILAATFLSDETSLTLPVALQRHVGSFSTDWGTFAAGAVIITAPVMALFFVMQRHLVGGLTAGGVKG